MKYFKTCYLGSISLGDISVNVKMKPILDFKLIFSNPYICLTQCRRPLIFQPMNYIRSNNLKFEISQFYTIRLKRYTAILVVLIRLK